MRALWSDRPNCSHNVSQKVKRIRRFSEEGCSRSSGQIVGQPRKRECRQMSDQERSNSGSHWSGFAIFRPAILTFYTSCPFLDFP